MSFSLRLALHRAAAARAAIAARRKPSRARGDDDQPADQERLSRPSGALIWAHFSRGTRPHGAAALLTSLCAERPDLGILATGHPPTGFDAVRQTRPLETPSLCRAFLSLWKPDLILWIGDEPAPVLWGQARRLGLPVAAVDADPAAHPFPLVREMKDFCFVLATRPDPRLTRLGVKTCEIRDRLCETPPSPPCDFTRLSRIVKALSARPVWLAMNLTAADIGAVLRAHRAASHFAHRLLLIARPVLSAEAALDSALEEGRWRVARCSAGDAVEEETEILRVEAHRPDDDGLWYRVAAISFLGGTLQESGLPPDPYAPASLGSVVLHGPHLGAHAETFRRLDDAGAARQVSDGAELGRAVDRLMSPERAAEMANAAWQVTTQGAETTDRARDLIEALLDEGMT